MTSNIVKVCKIHGNLTLEQTYIDKQRYNPEYRRCKECLSIKQKRIRLNNLDKFNARIWLERDKDTKELPCRTCKQILDISKFGKKQITYKYPRCKICEKQRQDVYYRLKKHRVLLRTYGVTLSEYEEMSAKQNHLCSICNRPESMFTTYGIRKGLLLDHCHKSNKVRGLLCNLCNLGIGHFREDRIALLNAIAYLDKYNTQPTDKET